MREPEYVLIGQVKILYSHLPTALLATLLNASVIAYVMRGGVYGEELTAWWWVNLITILIRFGIYFLYKRQESPGADTMQHFYTLFVVGSIIAAGTWAYLVFMMFPSENQVFQLFIAFFWAGMSAGAVSTLSSRFEIAALYISVLLIPLSLRFFLESGDVALSMGVITLVFWTLLMTSAWRLNKMTVDAFELAHNNDHLVKKLSDSKETVEKLNTQLEEKLDRSQEEVRHQEAILFQQSKLVAMGEMIGNIAHQWRQPLNTLALQVQDVEDAYEFGELDKEYIAKMVDTSMMQINFMSKTIDDFRDFVRTDQTMERFDLKQAISDALGLVRVSFERHDITIEQRYHSDTMMISGFVGEFKQVIINLLNNSKDAFEEHGIIKDNRNIVITSKEDEQAYTIEVTDRGGGIPEHVIGRIFEPYFTTKEEGKGTGIGLYMSYRIIHDKMQGDISVENRDDGVCFAIRLPKN